MLHDSFPGIMEKRQEIDGWIQIASQHEWYVPNDQVDLNLPSAHAPSVTAQAHVEFQKHVISSARDISQNGGRPWPANTDQSARQSKSNLETEPVIPLRRAIEDALTDLGLT
jgi:hypothetical protein